MESQLNLAHGTKNRRKKETEQKYMKLFVTHKMMQITH